MSWSYRIGRYEKNGSTLYKIVEYFTGGVADGNWGNASLEDWETVEDVQETVKMMADDIAKNPEVVEL